MFLAVSRLYFDEEQFTPELRDLKALKTSLESRFPAQVRVNSSSKTSAPYLVVCSLDQSQEKLGQVLDKIYAHCEDFGIGRIHREEAFLDDVDNLFDEEPY